jgi:hypothetical protein
MVTAARYRICCHRLATSHRMRWRRCTFRRGRQVPALPGGLHQFLVCECLLDAEAGWRAHVDAGRERWRLRQAAVVARDAPEVAARVLRGLGYTVEAPDPIPAAQAKALRNW